MAMTQERINQNLVNATSILNKALINIIDRQVIIFQSLQNPKMIDLSLLDLQVLRNLQEELDKMRARV